MIVYNGDVLEDFERIFEFIAARDPMAALDHIDLIRDAVQTLDRHPYIGSLISGDSTLRELIISVGITGYIALYEYAENEKLVRIVAIRHQREIGYRRR